jgi:hypothetical protein
LLTQGLSRSIQRELNTFYQRLQDKDFSIRHVTKGAFSQARAKLKPEAFKELNKVGLDIFYKEAPYLKWRGYRLLAIDGSTVVLPKHKTVEEEFGVVKCGPKADSPKSMARLSILFDVLNYTTLDGQIGSYDTSERALLKKHLEHVTPGKDLIVMDRGYPSLPLMFQLQQQGVNFCIRMRDDWWKEVRKMLENGEKDKVVTFKLPRNEENKKLLAQYKTTDNRIRCRLIVINIEGSDTVEILCTSVINARKLPYNCFESLYHYRWNIEEGIKLYKCRMQLEAFSGKTALAVKQDFYAKIFMMSTMAVLAFPIEEKIKKECEQSKRKHKYKINKTNALSMAREIICKIFLGEKKQEALKSFDDILESTKEIVRPNRKFPRNKIPKKPSSMNYKQL